MIGFFKRLLLKQLIAVDKYGNRYYQNGSKRWVNYKGMKDSSKIQPEYFLWLHNSVNKIEEEQKYKWEKDRTINLTGTMGAYLPDGHVLKNPFVTRKKDYIPWNPSGK